MNARTFSAHYSGTRRSPQASHRTALSRCERSAQRHGSEEPAGERFGQADLEVLAIEPLERDDLDRLVFGEGELCISLYLPGGLAGTAPLAGPIRLKNLIRQARQELARLEAAPEVTHELLAPIAALVDAPHPWPFESPGLALFSAPGFFRYVELSGVPHEQATVGRRFTLRPLVGALAPEAPFYVLALSLHQVRLVEVGPVEHRRIGALRLPAGLDGINGEGKRPGEPGKAELASYFRQVHKALAEVLPDRRAPLVLAAVEEHAPLYDQVDGELAPRAGLLPGNPDRLSDDELAQRARRVMRPHFLAERDRELVRFRELVGLGRGATALEEIVPAAAEGRVEVLFLADEGERWGHFETMERTVEVHAERRAGDEDLLETTLRSTLAGGGTVFTLPLDLLPHGEVAAATLRY
jgi:hypothetical protein